MSAALRVWPRAGRAAVAGLAGLAALLAGCSHPVTDRVVLLPQADGRPSAVEVRQGQQVQRLDRPYQAVEARADALPAPVQLAASAVQQRYGSLIALQPMRPRLFVVQFKPNSNQLTDESQPVLAEAMAALAQAPAPELVVIGHTDRVGSVEANDRLSVVRAETVRELLVAAGVPRSAVSVAGRGEREPAVPTDDEVAEARNRRVEIKLR